MDLGLGNRNALVVGASGGIGHAVASALADNGISGIALGVRDPERGQPIADELAASGPRTVVVACDLTDAGAGSAVTAAEDALGSVDILVQAAGNSIRGGIDDVSDDDWNIGIETKLLGSVRLTRAALPGMRERRWGRIVLVGGLAGRHPATGSVIGGVINAGLANFATAVARGVIADGVTVNVIDPHITDTPRWDARIARRVEETGASADEVIAELLADVPSGRPCPPEHVASTIAFLVSEHGASISGTALAVDAASGTAIY